MRFMRHTCSTWKWLKASDASCALGAVLVIVMAIWLTSLDNFRNWLIHAA